MTDSDGIYRRWIIANGLSEAAGLGTTFVLGIYAVPALEGSSDAASVVGAALAAIVLGALLEGVVVGAAQERVLRGYLEGLQPRAWMVATAVGAGLAWLIGMVPSTVMTLASAETAASSTPEPTAVVQYVLASALGAVLGPILGCAQWVVLRRHVPRASRWLWANAIAWAVGMPLIFVGMDYVPWNGGSLAVALSVYAVCGVAGLVVGAVHGRALVQLLKRMM